MSSPSLLRSPRLPAVAVLAIGLPAYLSFIVSALMADGLAYPGGGVLGGDFTAFWTAARAAADGAYPGIYDPVAFEAALQRAVQGMGTDRERFGLTWQYPPHAMLLLAPLAALPYVPGYLAFAGLGLLAFTLALRHAASVSWGTIGLVLASPALFQSVVCGQAGAWLGALLLGALLLPDRRPLVAGLCAGLLTIKPQLGVLLPVAYLAGGHGRAFGAAGVTTALMVSASVLAFGTEAWSLFLAQILGVAGLVGEAAYPLTKMPTVFAGLRTLGVPEGPAWFAQTAAALAAMTACWRVWGGGRRTEEKAAITAGLVFLCTPYAYYYDAPVLALPFLVAARGVGRDAPLRLAGLAFCFMAPIWMVGPTAALGAQIGLGAVLLLTIMAARPDAFRTPVRPGSPASA